MTLQVVQNRRDLGCDTPHAYAYATRRAASALREQRETPVNTPFMSATE
jgi:hypothetical protein